MKYGPKPESEDHVDNMLILKQAESKRIQQDVDAFIKAGGKITQIAFLATASYMGHMAMSEAQAIKYRKRGNHAFVGK